METNITEILEEFRKEYRKAYKGILPDEVLEKGNPWFENFLKSKLNQILDGIPCEKKSEYRRRKEVKERNLDSLQSRFLMAQYYGRNKYCEEVKSYINKTRK